MAPQLNAVQNLVIGGTAGALEVCLQQPYVAWKNALQGISIFSRPRFFFLSSAFLRLFYILDADHVIETYSTVGFDN